MRNVSKGISGLEFKRFSPSRTLFIIGPTADHPACKMQRRLLKPAVALFIREEIRIVELYGDRAPRLNGDEITWLDPGLLRHAMQAETGFFVIFVNDAGKTTFRSDHPVVASDVFQKVGLAVRREPKPALDRSFALESLGSA
ncbi:MAG: hypothetical protein AAGA22_04645 [Pseudomonadota bacterium]